jgi:hypothetical protein
MYMAVIYFLNSNNTIAEERSGFRKDLLTGKFLYKFKMKSYVPLTIKCPFMSYSETLLRYLIV